MTARERLILRTLFGTDNAKETARRFGISERYVRRVRENAMRQTGCPTLFDLARLVARRERPSEAETVPLWHLPER